MKDDIENINQPDRDDVTLSELLRLAGPRPPVPKEVESRVYDRVQSEWLNQTRKPDGAETYRKVHRQWKKSSSRKPIGLWLFPAGLVAASLLAVAIYLQPPGAESTSVPVATVAAVVGFADGESAVEIGGEITSGEILSTGAGQGLSLTLRNSASLRIDENSLLVALDENRFRLHRGRIYADTGDSIYADRALVVETSLGTVTDIGTQFSVATDNDVIDVAVREGRVDVNRGDVELVAVAGERLRVDRVDGADVSAVAPHDEYWDWTTSLAPAFVLENKTLFDFLRWAARETGRELVFESNELRLEAMRTDLHGSVSDFEPIEAVESVLSTTNFRYHIEPDKIVIEKLT